MFTKLFVFLVFSVATINFCDGAEPNTYKSSSVYGKDGRSQGRIVERSNSSAKYTEFYNSKGQKETTIRTPTTGSNSNSKSTNSAKSNSSLRKTYNLPSSNKTGASRSGPTVKK